MAANFRVRIVLSPDGRTAELFEEAYPSARLIRGAAALGQQPSLQALQTILQMVLEQLLPSVFETISRALEEPFSPDAGLQAKLQQGAQTLAHELLREPTTAAVLQRLATDASPPTSLEAAWQDTRVLVDLTQRVLEVIRRALIDMTGLQGRAAQVILANLARFEPTLVESCKKKPLDLGGDRADFRTSASASNPSPFKAWAQHLLAHTVLESKTLPCDDGPWPTQRQLLIERLERRVLANFWDRSLELPLLDDVSATYSDSLRERHMRTLPIAEQGLATRQDALGALPLARVRLVDSAEVGAPHVRLNEELVGVRWLQLEVLIPRRSGSQRSPDALRALLSAATLRVFLLCSLMIQRRRLEHALDQQLDAQETAHQTPALGIKRQVEETLAGVFAERLPRQLMGEAAGSSLFAWALLGAALGWWCLVHLLSAYELGVSYVAGMIATNTALLLSLLTVGLARLREAKPASLLQHVLVGGALAILAQALLGLGVWLARPMLNLPEAAWDPMSRAIGILLALSLLLFVLMVTLRTHRDDRDFDAFETYQKAVQSLAQEISEINVNVASQNLWFYHGARQRFEKWTLVKAPEQFLRELDTLVDTKEAVVSVERVLQTHKAYSAHLFQDFEARRSAARRKLLAVGSGVISGYFTYEVGSAVMGHMDLINREDPVGFPLQFLQQQAPALLATVQGPGCVAPTQGVSCAIPGVADVGPLLGLTCAAQCTAVQQAYEQGLEDWHQSELAESSLLLLLTFAVSLLAGWISARLAPD